MERLPSKHINTICHTASSVSSDIFAAEKQLCVMNGTIMYILLGKWSLKPDWWGELHVFLYCMYTVCVLHLALLSPAYSPPAARTMWTSLPLLPLTLWPIGFLSAICRLTLGPATISRHSLIESQVLEVQCYTDRAVSLPIDKDRRLGGLDPPQSWWGHVDKGVTSSLGRYCVSGTLLGLRDNGYPLLQWRLCS